jgi:hypothetical protein
MLPTSAVKIVCKVFDDGAAPETFLSYTLKNTNFYFSLSWNSNFPDRSFYSNDLILWDFGDDTNFIGSSAKHYYKYPNFYNVNATIYDKNGTPYILNLSETITAKNVFPDYIYLHPLNEKGLSYNLPCGKPSNKIVVTRYNSWQNEKNLSENNYTINLYASGCKSDHMTLSAYYSQKYSHLKAYHGFVNVSITNDNYIQTKLTESTKTNSVSVYAVPFTTGLFDKDWSIKFRFYNTPVEGSCFAGSSGTNNEFDYVYFVDQKPSDNVKNSAVLIYASFDSKNFNEKENDEKNFNPILQNLDQGYLNLPWSGQILKSIFNSVSTLRITSNGISVEGANTTVGKISAQFDYPFDIYPIKWTNSEIPFVISFKDDENYSVKNYGPIYDFHTGSFNNKINDINLKLVKFDNPDYLSNNVPLSVVEVKNVIFKKNNSVIQYNDTPYFAGTLKASQENKVCAISATLRIQDSPVIKMFPVYGFLSQIGIPRIRKYEKLSVFDYCKTDDVEFFYKKNLQTITNTSTANLHISFCPIEFLDDSKKSVLYVLDADNDKIYKTDVNGNEIATIDLSDIRYETIEGEASIPISVLNQGRSASPAWCCSDKNGNAYITLADSISTIKIDYKTNVIKQFYVPPFSNKEAYESWDYGEKDLEIDAISGNRDIVTIKNIPAWGRKLGFSTINQFLEYMGFAGENTIIPSSVDVDDEDNVYVAYTHPLSNFICKYKNNGDVLNVIKFDDYQVPQEIIVDADRNIWVGIENILEGGPTNAERNDLVYFIDGKTFEKTIIRGIEGFGMMTIDKNQNIYLTSKQNFITKIDANTKTKKDYPFSVSLLENDYLKDIGAIAIDSSNELWVVNNVDGKIYFADINNLSKPLSSLPFEKLKDLNLKTIQNLQGLYMVLGDWTGFRWMNKFIKTEIPQPRIVEGMSTYFDILNPTPTISKVGEEFDYLTQIKSYILQESLFNRITLLDDFIGQILGKDENVYEIGKVIYEKISNFVANNSDIDTCNIQQLLSLAEATGVDTDKFLYSFPPSVRRALDMLSITYKKLIGSPNTYNRNFGLSAYQYFENNNLGRRLYIEKDKFVAGKPIVTYELFSQNYKLITNTIVPNHKFGDMVPLSGVNYDWGWELVTGTREQSGLDLKDYYRFYEFIPNESNKIHENIINYDSKFTTITPKESSFSDWSKFAGTMDKVLSHALYKGLKMID